MKKPRKPLHKNTASSYLLALGVFVGILSLAFAFNYYAQEPLQDVSYTQFLETVERGDVKQVQILGNQLTGVTKRGETFTSSIANTTHFWDVLHGAGVAVTVIPPEDNSWFLYLMSFFIITLLFVILWFGFSYFKMMQDASQGGGGKLFGVGKSKARFYSANEIGVKFTDVAGVTEAKEDLQDIIKFLKNPKKFSRIGAKVPRGILLSGEPGNGKTLLAKAVAGEANCPFFSMSGSDFVEVFVGVGASRVRDLFVQARKHSPCIVFIDEIDAVGRKRGVGSGGGHDEREQTLNQLLTEMDGFATTPGSVIIIAATNRSDVLDKALLRPGRFDRIVSVPYPDMAARKQILGVHIRNVKLDPVVSLDDVARGTSGFSGAQLASLVNEAALSATKAEKKLVGVDDFEAARDKLVVGSATKSMVLSDKDKLWTAYHEVGHTMLNLLLPETDPFHKVTIIPHGRALGISWSLPEGDKYSQTKDQMLSRIIVALGGMIAEDMKFGQTTSGVASDLKTATRIARAMVVYYGMSPLGAVVLEDEDRFTSSVTAAKIDEEVQKIIADCKKRGKALLTDNWTKVETLVEKLIEKETMHAAQVYELLSLTPRQIHSFSPEVAENLPADQELPSDDGVEDSEETIIASSDTETH